VAVLRAFSSFVEGRRVSNEEMAALAGCEPDWIRTVSGIEERRFFDGSVADLAFGAASQCLTRAGVPASELGLILLASGSVERRFPGPAAAVAQRLGLDLTPAIDLPMASAGSLYAMALASRLAASCGHILVIGAERMSPIVLQEPRNRNVAVLFGDGAGACLVSPEGPGARVLDSAIHTDGAFSEDLKLEFGQPLAMSGLTVILQASRKLPRVIGDLLAKNGRAAADVHTFLLHQANRNLLVKVAQALGAPEAKFYSNIARYGNTSSASMLIAAAEWAESAAPPPGALAVFAAFGAGFHWGALLAEF